MSSAAPPPAPPAPQRFVLEVQPEAPGRRWQAVLVLGDDGTRLAFDTPLALLRFIARQTLPQRPGGLR